MATTMTATPQLDTASVLLAISGPPAEYPTDVLNLSAGEIYAEAASKWSGFDEATLYGDVVAFYSLAAASSVYRTVTGLTVGARYRLTLESARTEWASQFGVTTIGGSGMPAGSGTWAHTYEFVATATSHVIYFVTYQNNNPYIRRVILTHLPAGYDLASFTLTRTDANGIRPVRLLDGQEIVDGSLVIQDNEAAMVGLVTYQLTSASGAATSVTTSLESSTGYRLSPAQFPQFAATADLATGYTAARGSSTIAHEVIGRADTVARLGPMKSRRGTLTFWCADYAALTAILDVYRRGEVVLFRQPDNAGLDMYHVAAGDLTEAPYDEAWRRWRLDVPFFEVAHPRGPLLGAAGWTWDDVVAMFPTWDDVLAFFPTWNDLQVGP